MTAHTMMIQQDASKKLGRTTDSKHGLSSQHLTQFHPSFMFILRNQNNEKSISVVFDIEVCATPLHQPAA